MISALVVDQYSLFEATLQERCSCIDCALTICQAGSMPPSTGLRARMRAELTNEIKDEARRQLAAEGAPGLSLRAVTRALGMASSAIYRYFPSRDELLTALIVDAYDAIGGAAEEADAHCGRDDYGGRWRAVGLAIRAWAIANPHEYALVYGSPVPGYRAPEDTVDPASRVTLVLARMVDDAARRRRSRRPRRRPTPAATRRRRARPVAPAGRPGLPPCVRRGGRPRRHRLDAALRDDLVRALRPLPPGDRGRRAGARTDTPRDRAPGRVPRPAGGPQSGTVPSPSPRAEVAATGPGSSPDEGDEGDENDETWYLI